MNLHLMTIGWPAEAPACCIKTSDPLNGHSILPSPSTSASVSRSGRKVLQQPVRQSVQNVPPSRTVGCLGAVGVRRWRSPSGTRRGVRRETSGDSGPVLRPTDGGTALRFQRCQRSRQDRRSTIYDLAEKYENSQWLVNSEDWRRSLLQTLSATPPDEPGRERHAGAPPGTPQAAFRALALAPRRPIGQAER